MTEARKRPRGPISRPQREAFLAALSEGLSVHHAAGTVGRERRRFYNLRERDEAFAELWRDAYDAGTMVLEDEARRRALEGIEEPVYQGGKLVGTVRRYSDRLLEVLLRARRPEMYRENRVELTGPQGGPLQVASSREPATLDDLVRLAGSLGVLDRLGYVERDVIDVEPVEVPLELGAGS